MSIFGFFRRRRDLNEMLRPTPDEIAIFKSVRSADDEAFYPIFKPTHVHVRTGKQYMLTSISERLEVTGDDGYPLAEYEDADGNCFAQRVDRFLDGRFRELPL